MWEQSEAMGSPFIERHIENAIQSAGAMEDISAIVKAGIEPRSLSRYVI